MLAQEEDCPVPEHLLGQLYRAKAHGLDELVATVPAKTRAMLALYCYRRVHLQSIGLAVAASCEEYDLEELVAALVGFCSRKRVRHPTKRGGPITLSVET